MTLKVGYVQAACPTTTTTVDFTDSNAGFSSDVKAAIFFGTHSTAADTSTDDACFSLGFSADNSGTTQAAMALFSDDNIVLGTTVTARFQGSSYAYARALTTGGAPVIAGAVSSWLATGARLNITTADGTAPLINCLLLGGDIEAKVSHGVFATGTPNDATIAHGLAGTPDLVFGFTTSQVGDDSGNTTSSSGFFFWERTGSGTVGHSWKSAHGVGTSAAQSNTRSTDFYDNGNNDILTVNSVGGTNVVLRTNAGTTYDKRWHLLCVRGTSAQITTKSGSFQFPAGTGVAAMISGMAVAPQVVLTLQPGNTGAPPNAASSGVGSAILGFGAAITNSGGIKHGQAGFYDEDAASTTDSESRTSTKAIFIPQLTGNVSSDADMSSFNSDGVSINVTTAGTQPYQLYLAFGISTTPTPYVQPLPMRIVRHSGRYV